MPSSLQTALDEELRKQYGVEYDWRNVPEPHFTENSRKIFDMRFSRKDESGLPTEDPRVSMRRVALNVAAPNALYVDPGVERLREGKPVAPVLEIMTEFPFQTAVRQFNWLRREQIDRSDLRLLPFGEQMRVGMGAWVAQAKKYESRLLNSWRFLPNSPTWTGAGTPLGQLAACFVLPIHDDLGRDEGSIMGTLKDAAMIQQTGGGNGFSFSRLRPHNALIKTSMGKASGPVGFLKIYDATFGQIAQGGTRRGANMAVLRVDHPDIFDFIRSKTVEKKISNFNISVAVTDDFMDAVEKDATFDLVHDGKVYDTINARDLYDEIVQDAWIIGDPGSLFIDRANRDNPLPHMFDLESTNPCGEQWLGPYENCCLGSMNLSMYADSDFGEFDWDSFKDDVQLATQFLDDVVDANRYVPEVPALEVSAQGGRRIGLGFMGLADAMIKMRIPYNSIQGFAFASQMVEFMRFHSMAASIQRAKVRGPFPWIENSIYDPNLLNGMGPGALYHALRLDDPRNTEEKVHYKDAFLWKPPEPFRGLTDGSLGMATNYPENFDFGRPSLDWDEITSTLQNYGIRNCTQMTSAPDGTRSTVAGAEAGGCEPMFSISYVRLVMQDEQEHELPYLSNLFVNALRREGLDTAERRQAILEQIHENNGSCQNVEEVPRSMQEVFVTAADITAEQHVLMQATLQAFIDNSISKTINLPNEATVEDVKGAYRLAFDTECKGLTIYRQGSREHEVLSSQKKKEKIAEALEAAPSNMKLLEVPEGYQIVDDLVLPKKAFQPTVDFWPIITPMGIPEYAEEEGLEGKTYPVVTPFGKMWVTVLELHDVHGRPFDVRIQFGKAGNDKAADVEAIGRLASINLRGGMDVDAVIEQLEGIGGETTTGLGPNKVRSVADGLAQLLKRLYTTNGNGHGLEIHDDAEKTEMDFGAVDTTRVCPDCHRMTVVYANGCHECKVQLGGCGRFYACD